MDTVELYSFEQALETYHQVPLSPHLVDALNDGAFTLKTIDPARSIHLTNVVEQISTALDYRAGVGMAWAIRAYAEVQVDKSFSAQTLGTHALAICEPLHLHRGCGCALFGIAAGLMDAGDLDSALETAYRALEMFERSGDRDAVANSLLLVSLCYSMLNDIEYAEKYALHALTLYRTLGNRGGEWLQLNNLAYQYLTWGDVATAKQFGMEALHIHKTLLADGQPYHFQHGTGSFYHTLAEIALTENDVTQAEEYLIQGLALSDNHYPETLSHYYLFFALGRLMHRRNADTVARHTLVMTLQRATRQGFRPLVNEIQHELSQLYAVMGQPQKALHYYRRFHHNDKARYHEQLASKMRRLELKYVTEAAQRETELLEEKNRQLEIAYGELQAAHERIQQLSVRDSLTQLHNRHYFEEVGTRLFEDCTQHSLPFALLLVDIDDFKHVNDTYLHHVGDQVLIAIGSLLRNYAIPRSIVARIGGEEFVIALPDTPLELALQMGEALRSDVYTYPWHEIHRNLKVSVSIGVSSQEHCTTLSEQMIHADRHMYLAKHGGKNQVSIGNLVTEK